MKQKESRQISSAKQLETNSKQKEQKELDESEIHDVLATPIVGTRF